MFDLFGSYKFEINRGGSDLAGQVSSPDDINPHLERINVGSPE